MYNVCLIHVQSRDTSIMQIQWRSLYAISEHVPIVLGNTLKKGVLIFVQILTHLLVGFVTHLKVC